MTLNEAKRAGQARALEINDIVRIRRLAKRQFEIADTNLPHDQKIVILIHPS